MPLPALIHITAAYSNAVLVAVLPHFSEGAKQLDLPIITPITINQVVRFAPPIQTNYFQAAIWLTNGYWFYYDQGSMTGFRSPDNLYTQESFDHVERLVGKDNMTTNEAIDLARTSFMKLGYKLADFHMDEPPTEFEGAFDLQKIGHMPFCQVTWRSPKGETNALESYYLQFDVNMQRKRLAGMSLLGKKLWRPVPKIDATPELESDYQKRTQGKMFSRTNAPATMRPAN